MSAWVTIIRKGVAEPATRPTITRGSRRRLPFPRSARSARKRCGSASFTSRKPIVDTAERAGVRLSMHPCDPPNRNMRGSTRIFAHPDGLRRFLTEVPSKANGVTFCQGTITEMGVDVFAEIKYFVSRNRVNLVHFRTVRGVVPKYTEVFIDEGDIDMVQAMKVWKEAGYTVQWSPITRRASKATRLVDTWDGRFHLDSCAPPSRPSIPWDKSSRCFTISLRSHGLKEESLTQSRKDAKNTS